MTSGCAFGMTRTPSSAEAQVQMHSKPPNDSIICTQLRHKSSWSSTRATLIMRGVRVGRGGLEGAISCVIRLARGHRIKFVVQRSSGH